MAKMNLHTQRPPLLSNLHTENTVKLIFEYLNNAILIEACYIRSPIELQRRRPLSRDRYPSHRVRSVLVRDRGERTQLGNYIKLLTHLRLHNHKITCIALVSYDVYLQWTITEDTPPRSHAFRAMFIIIDAYMNKPLISSRNC